MIKRYYIEETDGKETKRTLTTFNELDDMRNYSDIELQEMIYETSANFLSKSIKLELLVKELKGRIQHGESDFDLELLNQADENVYLACSKIN